MSKESASVRAPSCANAADKQHHRSLQTSSGTHRTQHPRASPSCPKKPWESEHHLAKCSGQNGNTLAFKCLQALTGLNIPEFWRLVPGSREYPNLLAKMQQTKRHRRDLQRLQALTRLNIPEPRRLAPVSRENPITILQKCSGRNSSTVAFKRLQALTGHNIPQLRCLVPGSRERQRLSQTRQTQITAAENADFMESQNPGGAQNCCATDSSSSESRRAAAALAGLAPSSPVPPQRLLRARPPRLGGSANAAATRRGERRARA